jgi:hypothetical protein
MDHIEIKRPVVVKVIMTDDFKRQLLSEIMEGMKRIEDNLKRIEAEEKAEPGEQSKMPGFLEHSSKGRMALLEEEKKQLARMKHDLEWRLKELQSIQNGAEMPYRAFEGSVQLKVGDDFLDKMSRAELVLKDWKVVEIRQA